MKSFERLVEDKNRVIKECDDFINKLKEISLSNDNILNLIDLLSAKKEKYKELKYNNYEGTVLSIENIDEKIYRQIVLLEKQNIKEVNPILKNFGFEYKDYQKLKFILEKLKFIKNYYKSLITLLGIIPFIIYFVLNRNIGFIPVSESGDIFSLLVSLTLAGLSLLFILYLMPMLQLFFLFQIRDIKGTGIIYTTSVFLFILFVFLVGFFSKTANEYMILTYFILIEIIIVLMVGRHYGYKDSFNSYMLMVIYAFISFVCPIIIFLLIYNRVGHEGALYLLMFVIFLTFIVSLLLLMRDIYYFDCVFKAFIFINFALLCLLSGKIIQFSNFGNIEYKMLLVDKSTIDVLPIEICKKDDKDNGGKTCYEINRSIQLYNIKALSTLGKFYYLETKDGTKFELDASKIISREKQER